MGRGLLQVGEGSDRMTIARHYRMDAAEGKAAALLAALQALAAALQRADGFEGADLLRDIDRPDRFVFIEKWASVDAHKAAGPHIPEHVVAPLMEALAGEPDGSYLNYQ